MLERLLLTRLILHGSRPPCGDCSRPTVDTRYSLTQTALLRRCKDLLEAADALKVTVLVAFVVGRVRLDWPFGSPSTATQHFGVGRSAPSLTGSYRDGRPSVVNTGAIIYGCWRRCGSASLVTRTTSLLAVCVTNR